MQSCYNTDFPLNLKCAFMSVNVGLDHNLIATEYYIVQVKLLL